MARKEFGQHKKQTIIADDPAYDVGSDEWNGDAHNQDGVFGFDDPSETLLVSGVLTSPTDTHSLIVVGAESGVTDFLDTLTATNYQTNDRVWLKSTSGDAIDIRNEVGNFKTRNRQTIRLNNLIATGFWYDGTDWREIEQTEGIILDNVSLRIDPY